MHRHNGAVGVESRKRSPLVEREHRRWNRVERGHASGCRCLYDPLIFRFKPAFAIGGGIVGGLAYALPGGNEQAAKSIWNTSLYGTYLITPDHLQGNRPIRFLGVADPNDAPASAPAPEPIR